MPIMISAPDVLLPSIAAVASCRKLVVSAALCIQMFSSMSEATIFFAFQTYPQLWISLFVTRFLVFLTKPVG